MGWCSCIKNHLIEVYINSIFLLLISYCWVLCCCYGGCVFVWARMWRAHTKTYQKHMSSRDYCWIKQKKKHKSMHGKWHTHYTTSVTSANFKKPKRWAKSFMFYLHNKFLPIVIPIYCSSSVAVCCLLLNIQIQRQSSRSKRTTQHKMTKVEQNSNWNKSKRI